MRYLDVCSGYSAATLAWEPLGWECAGYSEIEKFPRAVLEQRRGALPVDWDHRHDPQSNVLPLFGDFTQIEAHHVGPIDLLVGGTPCQSFSIAGKRLGLDDPRGNLAIEFLALARRLGTEWVVFENVPGVYSSWSGQPEDANEGEEWEETADFVEFLNLARECGFRGGWRTLDAQYTRVDGFGRAVPQRRRRCIFVGHLGNGAAARTVLFDRESMCRNPAPRREAGQRPAPTISSRASGGGGQSDLDGGLIAANYDDGTVGTVSSKWAKGSGGPAGDECYNLVAQTLRGRGFDASEDGTGRETPLVAETAPNVTRKPYSDTISRENGLIAFNSREDPVSDEHVSGALGTSSPQAQAVAYDMRGRENGAQQWSVRRLTPRECERLQGVPDDFTRIEWRGKPASQCPDGPRYKAIGNSMAVNVMRWIGVRIQMIEEIINAKME